MNAYQDMQMLRISDLDDHCEGYGEFQGMTSLRQLVNESTNDMNYDDVHHNEQMDNNQLINATTSRGLINHAQCNETYDHQMDRE